MTAGEGGAVVAVVGWSVALPLRAYSVVEQRQRRRRPASNSRSTHNVDVESSDDAEFRSLDSESPADFPKAPDYESS